MDKRRLGGLLVVAVLSGWVLSGGGCAQGGGNAAKKDAARVEGADDIVARSAAGMDRVLKGEQKAGVMSGGLGVFEVAGEGGKGAVVYGAPAIVEPVGVATGNSVKPVGGGAVGESGGVVVEKAPSSVAAKPAAPSPAPSEPGQVGASGAVLTGWWGSGGVDAAGGGDGAAKARDGGGATVPAGAPAVSGFWKADGGEGGGQGAGEFRVTALALCSRVEGFGKFARVESVRATGKPVPLLVYTQVDGFAYRTRDGGVGGADDGKTEWVVDLGQSVVVYRMGADGKSDVQVKVEPEQSARDVAAFKRRDHFLVQRIELPTPLVAGKYVVKVTLRDKATGMVDERAAEVVVR